MASEQLKGIISTRKPGKTDTEQEFQVLAGVFKPLFSTLCADAAVISCLSMQHHLCIPEAKTGPMSHFLNIFQHTRLFSLELICHGPCS